MTKDKLVEVVKKVLIEASPDLANRPIAGSDKPIGGLGLDSLHGLQVSLDLEDALGIHIPPAENPLVEDLGKRARARTVDEIASWLYAKFSEKAGVTNVH